MGSVSGRLFNRRIDMGGGCGEYCKNNDLWARWARARWARAKWARARWARAKWARARWARARWPPSLARQSWPILPFYYMENALSDFATCDIHLFNNASFNDEDFTPSVMTDRVSPVDAEEPVGPAQQPAQPPEPTELQDQLKLPEELPVQQPQQQPPQQPYEPHQELSVQLPEEPPAQPLKEP